MPGPGGVCFQGGLVPGGLVSQHALRQTPPGETATAANGTHPTGMHSCSKERLLTNVVQKRYSFFSRFPTFFPASGHVDRGTGQVVVTRHDKRASERASLRRHQPRRDAGRNSV